MRTDLRPPGVLLFTSATPSLIAASEGEGGFHAPSITDFFPPAILFEGTPFQIDRIWIIRVLATVVLLSVFIVAARRAKLVPGRFQNVIELILDFVRVQVAEQILGKNDAKKFLPMLTTIFLTILAFNLTGLVPGLNLAGSSRIGLPIVLALWVFATYWWVGISKHGLGTYLKNNLFPPGIPPFVYLIVTPIELLQILIIRPASLAIRLAANMIAGHIMLVLCFAATHFFFLEAAPAMKALGFLSLAGGFAFTAFELLVAGLQAYIFALLAAVYISLSLEEEH